MERRLKMKLQGTAHKYGHNVNTDIIIPARYLNTTDAAELARHCMEDIDPSFAGRVKPGDLIIAGENFGCGSSREHAPIAIKAIGVSCVIARSFARIFYRNAINIGLPILECGAASDLAEDGDLVQVELETGTVVNRTKNVSCRAVPFPRFILELIQAGGLIAYVRRDFEPVVGKS
jgi:3-isopropylmalate/(R)-2-methylmalate dehydratase small subunit